MTSMFPSRKNARRTISGEVADHASTSRAPGPDIEAEADIGRTPDTPPIEDADRLSATNSEVESAMNHRRPGPYSVTLASHQRHLMPSILETRTFVLCKMV